MQNQVLLSAMKQSDVIKKMSNNKLEKNEYRKLPEPIRDATPEEVAQAIMAKPPKKEWRFVKSKKAKAGS